MLEAVFYMGAGALFILLGRWIYQNPKQLHVRWTPFNPEGRVFVAIARAEAVFFIVFGSVAFLQPAGKALSYGNLGLWMQLVAGVCAAWFLVPNQRKTGTPRSANGPTAGIEPQPEGVRWRPKTWTFVAILGFFGLVVFGILASLSSSDACQLALRQARANPDAVRRLGEPIQRGFWVAGRIEVTPASGHAELSIPVSGPRGKGMLYVSAVKSLGTWKSKALELAIDGDPRRVVIIKSQDGEGGKVP